MELSNSNASRRKLIVVVAVFLFLFIGAFVGRAFAQASVVEVNVFGDTEKNNDGTCSLREAIIAANKDKPSGGKQGECKNVGGADTILLPPGVYTLSRTDNGNEDSSSTGDLDIVSDITIKPSGPGVVVISGNGITDRVFHILSGNVNIEGVTIRDGRASDFGGGIYNQGGNLTMVNSTLTGNRASSAGGGLYNTATATLTNVTVTANSAPTGSGLGNGSGTLSLRSSIIAADTCQGSYTGSDNLAYSAGGCSAGITTDPQLQPVSAAGFSTGPAYFALPLGSPAVNAVAPTSFCPPTDQIGTARPSGSACDIGAFELVIQNVGPTANDDELTTSEDTAQALNVASNDTDPDGNLDPGSVSVPSGSGPSHGTAVPTAGQPGFITYTPDKHYAGSDSFDYEICDQKGACSVATVMVTVTPDAFLEVTNVCDSGEGSLRARIEEANTLPGVDTIVFDIIDTSCGTDTIAIQSQLPALSDAVTIDGLATDGNFTPPVTVPYITLEGGGQPFSGITILSTAGGSTISNLIINGFGGSGIVIGDDGAPSDGNTITGNTISNNGGSQPPVTSPAGVTLNDGITVFGVNNLIVNNNVFGNEDLNVDLEGDGQTPNDPGDGDEGANNVQNYPWLLTATPTGEITGLLNSDPSSTYNLNFYVSASCDGDTSLPLAVSPAQFATDSDGNTLFSTDVLAPSSLNYGQYVISTATDGNGNTSEYSNCIPVDDDNDVWPRAMEIGSGAAVNQKIIQLGQSRWYRFWISPDSKVKLTLENLPENYDLVYYGNIGEAYAKYLGAQALDLNLLDAESSTDAFAPAQFNPATFNPAQFNPAQFNPAQFNPAQFNPATFNPATFNPALFSADVYSPAIFNPAIFNPAQFNPAQFNPAQFNPATFNDNAYAAAQMSSVIAASGEEGTATEEISINSYNSNGWFYARVRGRQGAYDPNINFTLKLTVDGGVCEGIQEDFGNPAPQAVAGGYETVILVDWGRMGLNAQDQTDLQAKLNQLAAPAKANGVIVNVGANAEVAARNSQADQFDSGSASGYRLCPFAKNVVADGIKEIVDAYRDKNPIKYVVIVGDDDVIPFYRVPDQALLGPEEDYVVPVDPNSASEASLRNNYFLSQDGYGAKQGLEVRSETMPLPDIGVGRLVETKDEIINVIDAYLTSPVLAPQKALVTAYDFLSDGGIGVRDTLAGAVSAANINDDLLVENPNTWTAAQLQNALATYDFDVAFLSGHFSANAALAADYETYYLTTDFLATTPDRPGKLLYSAGCHSGYNIVNDHGIPSYTFEPDWPAAMARKGITLIAGTGYQYGDTDFVEYSERLYLEFTRQLRSNASTNIAVGDALARAKQQYLIDTPNLRGIHQKALLEATLFGLPMASVNMPGPRLNLSTNPGSLTAANLTSVNDNAAITTEPGEVLGLRYLDLHRNYNLDEVTKTFTSVDDPNVSVDVSYLENGAGGIVSNAGEPVLPLDIFNATVVNSNLVLRGVGFLDGNYTDFAGRVPLVGAPTTETSAVHFDFLSFVFYPQQPWSVNRIDALTTTAGNTLLNIMPGQYVTEQTVLQQQTATQRRFDSMGLRLFYLAENFMDGLNVGTNRPDLASAPTIVTVKSTPVANGGTFDVQFEVLVVGDPSAGIQQVWVSHTKASSPSAGGSTGSWDSLFLDQDSADSSIWRGTLTGITNPQNVRFIAQAASGTGLVTLSNNLGRFYIPGVEGAPTTLVEIAAPSPRQGAVGTSVEFSAKLTDAGGTGLAGLPVLFGIGQDLRLGWTSTGGVATVSIPLLGTPPGDYEMIISFPGTAAYAPSVADTAPFKVTPQNTTLTLSPETVFVSTLQPDVPLYATLKDATGRPLAEKTVTFTLTASGTTIRKAVITDPEGRARLGQINLPAAANYTVTAQFAGNSSYNPTSSTSPSLIKFNSAPDCSAVAVRTTTGKSEIWPTNNKFLDIELYGATDPDGDPLSYYFLGIMQDEEVGSDPDATITPFNQANLPTAAVLPACTAASVRAERDGNGNGRVYEITYLVEDGNGGSCTGTTLIATIPHDQGGDAIGINDGAIYNSLGNPGMSCSPH